MAELPALLCVTGREAGWDLGEWEMETCDRNKGIPRPRLEMDPDQSSRSSQPAPSPLALPPPAPAGQPPCPGCFVVLLWLFKSLL